jgi:DNA-binding transcriptional regulator YhcF (GntR family)
MQRALQELERNGLVFSQRTAGRFVTEERRLIDEAKKALAGKSIRSFLDAMSRLGYGKEEIIALIRSDTGEAMANANI